MKRTFIVLVLTRNNKLGIIYSHIHVRENETEKFDMLRFSVDYLKSKQSDLFIVLCGHGIEPPDFIKSCIDKIYWQNDIDTNEIGRGHPKFCINGYRILLENNINKSLKLRFCDIVDNITLVRNLLDNDSNRLVVTEQTCLSRGMIGDLLIFGDTKTIFDIWRYNPWDYSKSGLYNLYDNLKDYSSNESKNIKEFLELNASFVTPENVGWYTLENKWNKFEKKLNSKLDYQDLWGKAPGYDYYGGF